MADDEKSVAVSSRDVGTITGILIYYILKRLTKLHCVQLLKIFKYFYCCFGTTFPGFPSRENSF